MAGRGTTPASFDGRRTQMEARYRLGNNIRALRMDRGLTQEALASRSNMSPIEVSRAERGVRDMRVSTLLRFASALEHEPADLMRDVRGI